jgi:hypothetical protein
MADFVPISTSKGITYSDLVNRTDTRVIQTIIDQQIKVIDVAIATAHSAGADFVEHALPINFSFNNMSKAEAQTLIYSELLSLYKTPESRGGKGFTTVYITDISTNPTMHIKWVNRMNDDEKERRNRFIKSCLR